MTGFKSFAEAAEVEIEAGMTGIVGPNGCGKSNIVEGLRWVMGESNARQMRGSEMDDIIFAGTDQRPARNLAEITLRLDNSNRSAPSEFNDDDELEITRKIERGKGSSFLVNAKPARAKDVQLLFADSATGARSSGIVSQGRIGAIVGARPVDRRALLEEAANIKGLHARRHEAELRLRGAETNLERLDDVIAGLAEQRDSLRKQARQAARYRSVADRIRKAEAQLLLARWNAAIAAGEQADEDLRASQAVAEERTQAAAASATLRTERAAALPDLREAEVARAAEYQRIALSRDEIDREEARIRDAIERIARQQQQMRDDIARETSLLGDAESAIERLQGEAANLQLQLDEAAPRRDEAVAALAGVRDNAARAEARLADATAEVRAAAARRDALAARVRDLETRLAAANGSLDAISLADLETEARVAETALRSAGETVDAAQRDRQAADEVFVAAQQDVETQTAAQREAARNLYQAAGRNRCSGLSSDRPRRQPGCADPRQSDGRRRHGKSADSLSRRGIDGTGRVGRDGVLARRRRCRLPVPSRGIVTALGACKRCSRAGRGAVRRRHCRQRRRGAGHATFASSRPGPHHP